MSRTSESLIMLIMGFLMGVLVGISIGTTIEREAAIKADAAIFTVDPKTGTTSFKYITTPK